MSKEAPKGEKMTAEQRARFIANEIFYYYYEDIEILVEMTAEQIKAAEDDAREEGRQEMRDVCTKHGHDEFITGYAKGFADAVQLAALKANYFKTEDEGSDEVMAYAIKAEERIRALRPTGSGEEKCPEK